MLSATGKSDSVYEREHTPSVEFLQLKVWPLDGSYPKNIYFIIQVWSFGSSNSTINVSLKDVHLFVLRTDSFLETAVSHLVGEGEVLLDYVVELEHG